MSRKNNLKHTLVNAQSGASSFDTKLTPTNVDYLDNCSLLISYTGTLVGVIKVYVSNDKAEENITRLPETWAALEFDSTISVDGTLTPITVNLNQVPFSWLAVGYVATSGAGNLTVKLTSKMLG